MSKLKKCWILFSTMMVISSTANSGYAILSVVVRNFVGKHHWITEEEMEDYIALVQGTPGSIAINMSMMVGYHVASIWGAAAAVIGCAIPPLVIMLLVTAFYSAIVGNPWIEVFLHGMQAGVIAMLANLVLGLFRNATKEQMIYPLAIMAIAMAYSLLTDLSSILLVIGCILIGCAAYIIKLRKEKAGR